MHYTSGKTEKKTPCISQLKKDFLCNIVFPAFFPNVIYKNELKSDGLKDDIVSFPFATQFIFINIVIFFD